MVPFRAGGTERVFRELSLPLVAFYVCHAGDEGRQAPAWKTSSPF